jgi:hypothetical protein
MKNLKKPNFNVFIFKNYVNYFYQLELIVPLCLNITSILLVALYTILYNPYSIKIQIPVFIGVIIFNFGIIKFYINSRKISFMFFVLNSLLIFLYIRISILSPPVYLSLVYYFMIFLGFHIFENTFTKRFYLRTRIILKDYYHNSQYIKIILWIWLVFIPSLIKYPLILVTVYQPLMVFFYLFGYNKLLFVFSAVLTWCFIIFVMHKYKIGFTFLERCKNYFSRRACLHYIGNVFGSAIRTAIGNINPWTVGSSILIGLGVNNIPAIIDFKAQLINSGNSAAEGARKAYETSCKFNSLQIDPYESEYRQRVAYDDTVKRYRHGETFLNLGLASRDVPNTLDAEKFNRLLTERQYLQAHGLEETSKSLDELKQFQIDAREQLKVNLSNASKSPMDFKLNCKRVLMKIAEVKGQELNYSNLDKLLNNHTTEEIIEYVVNTRKEWDDDVYKKLEQFREQCDSHKNSPISNDLVDPVSKLEKHIYDRELLESTTNKPLTPDDVSVQIAFEDMFKKPAPKTIGQNIFVEPTVESDIPKRSIQESQSTDSGDSPSLDPADSKKVK